MNNLEGIWERGRNEIIRNLRWKMKGESRQKIEKSEMVEFKNI